MPTDMKKAAMQAACPPILRASTPASLMCSDSGSISQSPEHVKGLHNRRWRGDLPQADTTTYCAARLTKSPTSRVFSMAYRMFEAGNYGSCESCGQPIGKDRLQVFPRATMCVACKQREERR